MKDKDYHTYIEELKEVIKKSDEESLDERAERYAFLLSLEKGNENTMFQGRIAHLAFNATGNAYINAHFIGSIVLAQIVIDQTLNQMFYASGEFIGRKSFPDLIEKAKNRDWITTEEYEAFDLLKKIRNPYVHYRLPLKNQSDEETLLKRALDSGKQDYEILEEDAKHAITAMYKLINKFTF